MQGTRLERLDETEQRLILGFRALSPEWQQNILTLIATANEEKPRPPNIIQFPKLAR